MKTKLKSAPLLLILIVLFAGHVPAQVTFEAIPKKDAPKYKFDLARNFFSSKAVQQAELKKALLTLTELEKCKGKVAASADNLLRCLELADRADVEIYKHVAYFSLQNAVNTKDETSSEESSRLSADLERRTSFLQQELMRIDERQFARFAVQKPALKEYAFVIESARRFAPHTLSLKEEELLSEIEPLASDWTEALFQRAVDRTDWGKIKSGDGSLDVYQQYQEIANSPDATVREQGFYKTYAALASQRDIYAFTLTRLIKTADRLARVRKYRDRANEVHFEMFLTTAEVRAMYEKIARTADIYKRFQRMRVERVKKQSGLDEVKYWDRNLTPKNAPLPRFTIAETTRILQESLAVLGPEYSRELSDLMDPANGRLDIVGGENRRPGAFANASVAGYNSVFFSFNYEGYFDDVDALAHEAGHAVHYQLLSNNRVPAAYGEGQAYFTESFAMFNELVVIDHLYNAETDLDRKIYFLEQFMTYANFLYSNTVTAALEQEIYDAVARSDASTADEFDAITKRVGSRFSIWYDKHDELKMRWMDIHHFYDAPMYYPNYVYAQLLALKYYEMYKRDPKTFVPKYLALMRNGFNAPPSDLLKKYLSFDLKDPQLVPNATNILKSRLDELDSLYKK
ncbi:MAG TPA: M3 family metallopeptidase [Pyrinomonadaceae bacterium]|nr:M3 family metallopeptidase [Pyrinomonadaceae bacterium]